MIQPLPQNHAPAPFPGAPIEGKLADLFAALLAGQGVLPPSNSGDILHSDSEPQPEPESPSVPLDIAAYAKWPWADAVVEPAQTAGDHRILSPAAPKTTNSAPPHLLDALDERVPEIHPGSKAPYKTAPPDMRTLELMVDPDVLTSRTPVSLSKTFYLDEALTGKSLANTDSAPETHHLPMVTRPPLVTPAVRLPEDQVHAPMAVEHRADLTRPRRSVPRAEAELVAKPSMKTERGPAQRVHADPDSHLRSGRAEQHHRPGEGSGTRPLGITREFEPSTRLEPQRSAHKPSAPVELFPTPDDTTQPVPGVTQDAVPVQTRVERPVLLEATHEDATVRFVLEDWNPNTPVRSIRIALEPRDLGTLNISLQHRQGQVHARVLVDNAQALHVVQTQAAALQRSLAEQGLNFGSFSVTLASNAAWTGLPVGGSQRAASGDPERKEVVKPRRVQRDEVKTT